MRKFRKIIFTSPKFANRVINDSRFNPFHLETDESNDRVKYLLNEMIGELEEKFGEIFPENISDFITELGYMEDWQEVINTRIVEEQLDIEAR